MRFKYISLAFFLTSPCLAAIKPLPPAAPPIGNGALEIAKTMPPWTFLRAMEFHLAQPVLASLLSVPSSRLQEASIAADEYLHQQSQGISPRSGQPTARALAAKFLRSTLSDDQARKGATSLLSHEGGKLAEKVAQNMVALGWRADEMTRLRRAAQEKASSPDEFSAVTFLQALFDGINTKP